MRSKHTSQIHKKDKREKERYTQAETKLFLDLHAFDADKLTQKVNITFHVKGNSQVSRTRLNTRRISSRDQDWSDEAWPRDTDASDDAQA